MENETVSVTEAAKIKGMSPQSVRVAIKEGKIKARQSGGIWLVDVQSLNDYQKIGHRPKKAVE